MRMHVNMRDILAVFNGINVYGARVMHLVHCGGYVKK